MGELVVPPQTAPIALRDVLPNHKWVPNPYSMSHSRKVLPALLQSYVIGVKSLSLTYIQLLVYLCICVPGVTVSAFLIYSGFPLLYQTYCFQKNLIFQDLTPYLLSILPHESLSDTIRLNTGFPGKESFGSTQK